MPALSHQCLVKRGARWLRNSCRTPTSYGRGLENRRCNAVFTEANAGNEIADCLGFALAGKLTVLLECKTSLSDFFADQQKPFRRCPYLGMGSYRYYFAEAGLLPPTEIPENWGLLELKNNRVKIVIAPTLHLEKQRSNELGILYSYAIKMQNQTLQAATLVHSQEEPASPPGCPHLAQLLKDHQDS